MRKLDDTDKFYGEIFKALESTGKEIDPNFDDDSKDKSELDQNFGSTTKNHQSPDIDNNKQGETVEAESNPDKVEDEGIDPNKDSQLHQGEAIKEGDNKDIDENFDDESSGTISNNFKDESSTVKSDDHKWDQHPDMTGEVLRDMGYEGLEIYGDYYGKEAEGSNAIDNKDFDANKEDESDGALDANFSKTTDITDEAMDDPTDYQTGVLKKIKHTDDDDTEEATSDPTDYQHDVLKRMTGGGGEAGQVKNTFWGEADKNHEHDNIFDTNFEDKTKAGDEIDLNFTTTNELSDETASGMDYDVTTSDASDDYYGGEAVGNIEDVNQQFKEEDDLIERKDVNADRTGLVKKKGFESLGCTFTCNCGAEVGENAWESHVLQHAKSNEHIVPVEGLDEPDPDGKASEDNFYNPDPNHDIGSHTPLATTGKLSDQRGVASEAYAKEVPITGHYAEGPDEDDIQYMDWTCPKCGKQMQVDYSGAEMDDHLEFEHGIKDDGSLDDIANSEFDDYWGTKSSAPEAYLGDGAEQYQVHTCDVCGAGPFKVTGAVDEMSKHMEAHAAPELGEEPPTGAGLESKKNDKFLNRLD